MLMLNYRDLPLLAEQIHATAVSKGWWDEKDGASKRPFSDQVANFHAEVSEAWEEYRSGHAVTEVYYGPLDLSLVPKPEGIPVELADTVIRILDTAAAYSWPIADRVLQAIMHPRPKQGLPSEFSEFICLLHRSIDQIYKPSGGSAGIVIFQIMAWCDQRDIDLAGIINLKMGFNQTRPHRHGGKVA